MRAVGAHVKIDDGRYLVGLSVIDGGRIVAELTYPAPADRDEAGQLNELYEWVSDAVATHGPDEVALRIAEYQALGAPLDLARRAEGVVLAGARQGGAPKVSRWSRKGLVKPLGARGEKAKDVRDAVPSHLARAPSAGVLTEAACAAVACGAGA